LKPGPQNVTQKFLVRTETFCAECRTDVTVFIIEKDVGNHSCSFRIFVGCNIGIDVPYTINQTSLLYSGRTFCGCEFEKPFVAIDEQLTPLITLWCKEKDFVQSATGLALHMVCTKREGTYV